MTDNDDAAPGDQDAVPLIQLRVPGLWKGPEEFSAALLATKTGWRVESGEALVNDASGQRVTFGASDHDDQLGDIFRGGHSDRLSDEELDLVDRHTVKIHIHSPGGSPEAARVAVEAAAAVVRAGGVGVFVDNSGLCHGPGDFLKLAGDPDAGGLYWAFVILTASRTEMFSAGMHCLGFRDCRLPDPPPDRQAAAFVIHNFLGYIYQSGAIVTDGDALDGPDGPLFRAFHEPSTKFPGSAMHNPYGVWRLELVMGDFEEEEE
ncbi:MAG TPA: hypothetical protein VFE47_24195 [Tepidisphaeraceae bacterium]|jgi:hypothetical protein|nr:hypothetical protein [Tepidisphaeraceae bacterium]